MRLSQLRLSQRFELLGGQLARNAAGEVALQVVLADHQDAGDGQIPGRGHHKQRDGLEDHAGDVAGTPAVTSDVVFSMLMTSLPVGGMITRIACGSTVRRIVIDQDMPSAVDASDWPSGTELMPARMIS